jgi:malate dehydrogenase
MKKITIVGAGRVGEATAQALANGDMAQQIVLLDIREGAADGAALDVQETAPIFGFDAKVTGSTDNREMRDSDLVIITAGFPRKPGMSRSDVLEANLAIIDQVVDNVLQYSPDSMLLLVTNPVDALTYRAWKRTGWSRERVFGQAGVLDSTRMASFVAMETGFSVKDINAMVLGGHGDTMVPMCRYTTVNGIPIDQFLSAEVIEKIVERTRKGGAEILALRKHSSAYDAPAAAVAAMVDAISVNRKRLLPCVSILQGEYGLNNIAMGVPVVMGQRGLERVVELSLNDIEQKMFDETVATIKADLEKIPE